MYYVKQANIDSFQMGFTSSLNGVSNGGGGGGGGAEYMSLVSCPPSSSGLPMVRYLDEKHGDSW